MTMVVTLNAQKNADVLLKKKKSKKGKSFKRLMLNGGL